MVYTKQMYEEERKLAQSLLQTSLDITVQQKLKASHVLQGTILDERFIEIYLKQNGSTATVSVVVQGLPQMKDTYSLMEYDVLSGTIMDTTVFDESDAHQKGRIMWWKNQDSGITLFARGLQSMLIEAKGWTQVTEPESLFFSFSRT